MNDKTLSIIIKAQDQASKVMAGVGDRAEAMASKLATAAGIAAKASGVALAGAMGLAAKASFDQVGAVQQATLALSAYEPNASAVSDVLKGLIGYAQSDMGVLFNRKDLFASAQNLKIMGDTTSQLTEHVKILSRSVGLGLSNWTDLNQVVGRVGSTGRLTGDDFDNLTKAGFKLDPALRNTSISFDALFKAMDKGIPVNALEGQANTMQGLGIRFQTAFRGIGDAILGVDTSTNQFIQGGIGDRLQNTFKGITAAMKTEDVKNFFAAISNGSATVITRATELFQGWLPTIKEVVTQIGDYLGPKFEALWNTISTKLLPVLSDFWHNYLEPLMPVIGTTLVVAIGLATDALNIIITSFSWLLKAIEDGNPFIWGLIAIFGSLATAMAFNAVFNALNVGFATLQLVTIPSVMASVGALRAAIIAPMAMASIEIAAPLAALAIVLAAAKTVIDTINVVKSMNAGIEADRMSTNAAISQMKALTLSSDAGQRNRAYASLHKLGVPGYAEGTNYAPGGMAVVGERGPELVNLPRGSKVYSNEESKSMGRTFNMHGNIIVDSNARLDQLMALINGEKEMASYGVGA